ncbi:hypothetical protein AtNW77_Chr4g0300011 [Arabidopsis thaliana]
MIYVSLCQRSPAIRACAGIIVGITVVLTLVISVLLVLGYSLCRRRKASQEFATERSSMTTYGTAPPENGNRLTIRLFEPKLLMSKVPWTRSNIYNTCGCQNPQLKSCGCFEDLKTC